MTMLRSLAPHVAVALAVILAGAVIYNAGADAWIAYLVGVVALLVIGAGYLRWEQRQHSAPRR